MSNESSPFPKSGDVPILGQPCSINAGFATVSITCRCEAMQPLLLVGFHTLVVCQHCGRGFRLLAYVHDTRTGLPPVYHIDIVLNARPLKGKEPGKAS